LDLVRRLSPEERLRRALELSAAVRQMGEAGIRQAYPGASEQELFMRIAERQLGKELSRQVYPNGSAERHS